METEQIICKTFAGDSAENIQDSINNFLELEPTLSILSIVFIEKTFFKISKRDIYEYQVFFKEK